MTDSSPVSAQPSTGGQIIDRKERRRQLAAAREAQREAAKTEEQRRRREFAARRPAVSIDTKESDGVRRRADEIYRQLCSHFYTETNDDKSLSLRDTPEKIHAFLKKHYADDFAGTPITLFTDSMVISRKLIQQSLRAALLARKRLKRQQVQALATPRLPKREQTPLAKRSKPKPSKREKPQEQQARYRKKRTKPLEDQQHKDIAVVLSQVQGLEQEGNPLGAARMLLQLGNDCVPQLERMTGLYLQAGAPAEMVAAVRPYTGCTAKLAPAVRFNLAAARYQLHQYDHAIRVAEPLLSVPEYRQDTLSLIARSYLQSERPYQVPDLLQSSSHHALTLAANLAIGLLTDDVPQVARALKQIDPETVVKEKSHFKFRVEGEAFKLAPASYSKCVTLAEAFLELEQPERALVSALEGSEQRHLETGKHYRLFARGKAAEAQAALALADIKPGKKGELLNRAFNACAAALDQRPTDSQLLTLAGKVVDASGCDDHRAKLAARLEFLRTAPTSAHQALETGSAVAEELQKGFAQQELVRVERLPHLPSQRSRRAGQFNYRG